MPNQTFKDIEKLESDLWEALLTLDRHDGGAFYGLVILKPGDFLKRERAVGKMRTF